MIRHASLASGTPTALETNGTVREAGGVGRQAARAAPGVPPALLDVLHDPADPYVRAVTQRVDINLCGVLQKPIQEDGRGGREREGLRRGEGTVAGQATGVAIRFGGRLAAEIVREALARVHDLHRPAAEHVGRAHEQRIADLPGLLERL